MSCLGWLCDSARRPKGQADIFNGLLVERWFRDLTQKRLRRGTFHSVNQLRGAIEHYIDQHNENPQPFVWTAKADEIIAKVSRARAALDKSPSV